MRKGGARGDGDQSVGMAGWPRCRCSDEFTLIERRRYRVKDAPKAAQRFASVLRHKERAAQKVVTTFEADAKSSDHLLTRSHEGATQSTTRDPSACHPLLSLLGIVSLINHPIVFTVSVIANQYRAMGTSKSSLETSTVSTRRGLRNDRGVVYPVCNDIWI